MSKPDWAWMKVDKEKWGNEMDGYFFRPEHVIKLLRQRDAKWKRAVKRLRKEWAIDIDESDPGGVCRGAVSALDDLIAAMEDGRK